MAKVRTTVYIGTETNAALRDYARRHRISIGEANNQLLRRALFGGLDEGTEATHLAVTWSTHMCCDCGKKPCLVWLR